MVSQDHTHYDVLGVEPSSGKDAIRDAYQNRLDEVRADLAKEQGAKRPNEAAIDGLRREEARVRAAWQVLSDPYQRGRYDATVLPDEPGFRGATAGDEGVDEAEAESASESAGDEGAELTPARAARQARPNRRAEMDAARPPVFTDDGSQLELAATNRRAAAAVIDVVTMAALYFAITGIVSVASDFKTNSTPALAAATGTLFAVVLFYMLMPSVIRGQTLGKRLTWIMLVDRASGHLPPPARVFAHYGIPFAVLVMLPGFGAPLGLMLGLSFLMTKDGMSLGDRLGKTAVIVARYRPERIR